jgi:hypothetical protein
MLPEVALNVELPPPVALMPPAPVKVKAPVEVCQVAAAWLVRFKAPVDVDQVDAEPAVKVKAPVEVKVLAALAARFTAPVNWDKPPVTVVVTPDLPTAMDVAFVTPMLNAFPDSESMPVPTSAVSADWLLSVTPPVVRTNTW